MNNLNKKNFNWNDIEIKDIKQRAAFINLFNGKISQINMNILNTVPFEQLIPLKFVDMITNYPENSFGKPIYNESLNFFTYLIDFFKQFYLQKDFQTLDKIDAEFIETYTPISRDYLVKKNLNKKRILDKYFNSEFNLYKFSFKLMDKFVVKCSWRWIGGYHKAHIYSVELCKIIMEYGLLNDDQMQELKAILYKKIESYRNLEVSIANNEKNIGEEWIKIWSDGLIKVREFYCEILILIIYRIQDQDLLAMLKRFHKESKGDERNICEKKLEYIINFNKSILFEEKFGKNFIEFFLGYILSQRRIANNLLITPKIEKICVNFLHIFWNIDDPYLYSIKLIREQDYQVYMQEEPLIAENPKNDCIFSASLSLSRILNNITFGHYLYKNEDIHQDLEKIFEDLNQALDFEIEVKSYDLSKKNKNTIQRILLNSNFEIILLNLIGLLAESNLYKAEIMHKFSLITQYFLLNNTENHCIFLTHQYLHIFFYKIYEIFPFQTIEMFYNIFSKYSKVMLIKEFLLDQFLDLYSSDHDKFDSANDFLILNKFIDILSFFINLKDAKIFTYFPEYDIRIANSISKRAKYFNSEEIETLLINPLENPQKLALWMNMLRLMQNLTNYRFTDNFYTILNTAFPIKSLKLMIEHCQDNLSFRSILMDLYSNIHIDFKNQLLDNRSSYFHTKPTEKRYSEDPFVDNDYDITLQLLKDETEFLLNYWHNASMNFKKEDFKKLSYFSLFSAITKLMNYFLMLKEEDIAKLDKYIIPLEDFKDFIFNKKKDFKKIFKHEDEFTTPMKKQLEIQLSWRSGFQNFLFNKKKDFQKIVNYEEVEIASPIIKELEIQLSKISGKNTMEKLRILGSCKGILETCQQIIEFTIKPGEKKNQIQKLFTSKSLIEITSKAYKKSLIFSNNLQIRKENLSQIMLKDKKTDKLCIIYWVSQFYEKHKMNKIILDGEKNVYFASLKDTSDEMTALTNNFCSFICNKISNAWDPENNNTKYKLIACLCHTLFISTSSMQENLYQVLIQIGNDDFLNNVWIAMINSFLYLKYKTKIDKFWNETFTKTLILLQFHQFFYEDNNVKFKKLFSDKILPNDIMDRVLRWTTIFQKLCEQCDWHQGYEPNEICDFERVHKHYLLPLATKTLENLAELCTGPCVENQKKIYKYIYDKYNGVLKRYWRDPDSEFYKMKLAVIEFINTMIEGLDQDIVSFQTTNFDLKNVNNIMVNSLKQLYYCKGLKQKFIGKSMDNYELKMTDFDKLMHFFETSKDFSNHTLLSICTKLYSYIKMLAIGNKTNYAIFIKEREDSLALFEKKKGKGFNFETISEQDLLTYKFLNKICIKVEIIYAGKFVDYYFQTLTKSFYLSETTKQNFMKNVDRSSGESKVSGLMSAVKYFEIEMEHNQQKYQNFYFFYRVFSSKSVYFLELLCLFISIIINSILLTRFYNDGSFEDQYANTIVALGVFEVSLSFISIILWVFLNYSVIRKINHENFIEKYAWKDYLGFFDNLFLDVWKSFFLQKSIFIFFYHITIVLLGLNVSYGFYGIDLFAIISLFPTMQYIIKSVTEHVSQLISTLILACIIMFAYGLFMHIYFIHGLSADFEENCSSSLAECYFLIINKAFLNGEGVGGLLKVPFFGIGGGDGMYYSTLILNLSFFLIINTVFLNIILAVLVDTFSELRGRSDEFSKKN